MSPLLVAVHDQPDGSLQDAAGRAVAAGRPLIVAVVAPPLPLSTHPLVQLLAGRRLAGAALAARVAALRGRPRLVVEVVVVRAPRGLTAGRRRHALEQRLRALARARGAERHPDATAFPERPGGGLGVGRPPGADR